MDSRQAESQAATGVTNAKGVEHEGQEVWNTVLQNIMLSISSLKGKALQLVGPEVYIKCDRFRSTQSLCLMFQALLQWAM